MKKILFGITSLTLGGAERVLVDLANQLCNTFEITIFTIYAKGELEKQLDPKIKLKTLFHHSFADLSIIQRKLIVPLKVLFRKNAIYHHIIKDNYDVEVAFLEGPITRLFSVKNTKTRKIAWIHNDISLVFGNGIKAKLKKKIDRKIYSQYQELIFVSQDNLNNFTKIYSDIEVRKKVIYNYINKEDIIKKANEKQNMQMDKNKICFLTVARLVKQKAIDRIIEVHSDLIKKGLNHNFYVIGEGEERQELERLIEQEKVEETFKLLGKKENPYPYIKNADYFCLLSKFEGYGMTLEEAKILNKPIIITDTAAREAVEDYEDKLIAKNSKEGIIEIMEKAIHEYNQPKKEKHNQEYNNDNIIKEVIDLLEGIS